MLAYITPDQTAKTVTKFLYAGYISIFGALARLLSNRGASFTSNVIEEMCKIHDIKWLQTMPYHPQTNGLVERLHQTIMCMIRKLGEDKKADWPSHLAEIVHMPIMPSNLTVTWVQSTLFDVQVNSLGSWFNFVFPIIGSNEAPVREASAKCVDIYVASVWDRLSTALYGRHKPNQWQKYADRNSTMTERLARWTWSLATWY